MKYFILIFLIMLSSCSILVKEGPIVTQLKKEGKKLKFNECQMSYNLFLGRTYLKECQEKSIDL